MKTTFVAVFRISRILMLVLVSVIVPACAQEANLASEWKEVEGALGRKGSLQAGDVFKFSMPRSDLKVTVAGTPIKAGLALGSWAAFKKAGDQAGGGKAAITGDFVLIGSEVNPVIRALGDNGIAVTAVHSHMVTESPRLFFMHFWANDDAVKLANGLRAAIDKTNSKKRD